MGRGEEEHQRRTAAGLLLRLVREAAGLRQDRVASKLSLTADRIGDYERGDLPLREGKERLLQIAMGYGLPLNRANQFLHLLGQSPATKEEWSELGPVPTEEPEGIGLLFSAWHDALSDAELAQVVSLLGALREVSERYGLLKQEVELLTENLSPDMAVALVRRGVDLHDIPVHKSLPAIEGLLAEVADVQIGELRENVQSYIESGMHNDQGRELANRLRELMRIAPRRRRPELRYLLGWLRDYNQEYIESASELDRALQEFIVDPDDVTSLWTVADASYVAALAYLDIGDLDAFPRARLYLQQAQDRYRQLEDILPGNVRQMSLKRLNSALQQARIMTWGYRRGMGVRFREADDIYRSLLEDPDSQKVLETNPFFHATVLKERGDNLRVEAEANKLPELPPEAREHLSKAIFFYDLAEGLAGPRAEERRVECTFNRAYIRGLLGEQQASHREMQKAHRLALAAGLRRQIALSLQHMAEAEWRGVKSRAFCAVAGAAIAERIGSKRVRDVCQGVARNLGPQVEGGIASLAEKLRRSRYKEFL
ncbi:MAG: helix-turn-helix transcriptional regulator [Bacillota bacterium]|nr:helix-turn-helix transcriptional regulator [Bacillota bacterium]